MPKAETSSGFPIKETPHFDGAGFNSTSQESRLVTLLRHWDIRYNATYHLMPFENPDVELTDPDSEAEEGRFKMKVTRMRTNGDGKEVIDREEFFTERQIQNTITGIKHAIEINHSVEEGIEVKGEKPSISTEGLKAINRKLEGMQKFSLSVLDLPAEPLS